MRGEIEAAGDALTGAVLAGVVENEVSRAAARPKARERRACRNCGATLIGRYCAYCGQPAHLHRSLISLGHDILHGVFHFEGKIWRTIPELSFRPGRLTRRYIDGERAKFVSPMALFLFAVFLMFAVFSFTGGALLGDDTPDGQAVETEDRAEAQKSKINVKLISEVSGNSWPPPGSALYKSIERLEINPELVLYKLKTNGYKFSWALIPLSLPFLWLLFFWRRDVHLYDHAVFVTYSISFMMLLLIALSLAAVAGVSETIRGMALVFVPPIHIYRQLRGAYGLSRFGALVRLSLLLMAIMIILAVFITLLAVVGVLV